MQLNDQLRKYFSIDMVFKAMYLLSGSNSICFINNSSLISRVIGVDGQRKID